MSVAKYIEKFERDDNVRTKKIETILEDALTDLNTGMDFFNERVEEIEFESRSGFIPFSHNRGGRDLICYTTIGQLSGSGYHTGTKIESCVDKANEEVWYQVIKDNPELNENNESDRDVLYEQLDNILNDDYSMIAFRIRLMYEGNGVLMVYSGWDKDAPYFRWSASADLEQTIKFKTKKELKTKLKKAINKAIKDM